MTYYFYTYYRNPKITLHRADCGFCKKGKGMQTARSHNGTGRWRGSYSQFEQAVEAARLLSEQMGVEPTYCQRCLPDQGSVSLKN
ncbi:hypothetical protein [Spirosoma aerolatum]|uniref:hypothetical protein n=1 Tax=Spirosoma aerolatum TaxID=1211326 RepID=UPI0009AD7D9B|nr:hypothetical protein [Spirosoma aerolatum]